MLRLRDRHPVAGDDHDALGIGEHDRHVVGARRADRAAVGAGRRGAARGDDLPERAEEDVRDRAVHRAAHHQRQQRARGADEHAAHDQDVVLELEAGRSRGEAGERVQQRDHDRHVGPADRQHEQDSEQARAEAHRPEQPLVLVAGDDHDAGGEAGSEQQQVADLLARIRDRPALDQLLQLRERDHRPGERDRADQGRERERDADVALQVSRRADQVVELRERDQRCGAAADAVEQRHHLRHRGHLHAPGRDCAERAADDHADGDLPVADDLRVREGDRDRDEHADGADLVATPRRRGIRQEPQREDEGHDRDQVREVSRVPAHQLPWSAAPAF